MTESTERSTGFRSAGSNTRERPFPYTVGPYRPENETAVLSLLRQTVGETEGSRKSAAFWRWKHAESPFGPSHSLCAWAEDGTLAGFRTIMRWTLAHPSGRSYQAARPVDTATHPVHRRKGIFSVLTGAAVQQLEAEGTLLLFNTPNRNSLPGYVKMGWAVVARWPLYARPIRWANVGSRLAAHVLRGGQPNSPALQEGEHPPTWKGLEAAIGDELSSLVSANEARRSALGLRTPRTPAYLHWRYGGHPDIVYRAVPIRAAGRLEGVVVGRLVEGFARLRAFVVTELFMREPSAHVGARALVKAARETRCDYVLSHFRRGSIEHAALRRAGFLRAPGRGYTLVSRALSPVDIDPSRAEAWDISLGELEIF